MKTYGLAPEWKRIGWYVPVLLTLCGVAHWYVGTYAEPGIGRRIVLAYVVAVSASFVLTWWLYHVRYCASDEGIARRILFFWAVWPWDDFASGRIRLAAEENAFVDPARAWWRRRMSFAYLSDEAGEAVFDACLKHWVAPDVEEPGEEPIQIRLGLLRRQAVDLRPDGITVDRRGQTAHYSWGEVEQVLVGRSVREQQDFVALRIALPGDYIVLRRMPQLPSGKTWRGPTGEVILGYLFKRVREDRTRIACARGKTRTPDDHALVVARWRQAYGSARWMPWLYAAVLLAYLAYLLRSMFKNGADGFSLSSLALCGGGMGAIPCALLWVARILKSKLTKAETAALEVMGPTRLAELEQDWRFAAQP